VSDTIDPVRLDSVLPLESDKPEAQTVRTITTLSADTQKRNYPHLVVRLSPGREGMTLRNALDIAAGRAQAKTPSKLK
jgi:hypothetical protein